MTAIEDELRQLLDAAAPEPPAGSGPPETFTPYGRRWVLPLAAAAAIAVLAAGAVALSRNGTSRPEAGVAPRSRSASTAGTGPLPVPPGSIAVGYYGISVTVPSTFTVGPQFCVAPQRDAVIPFTDEASLCPVAASMVRPPEHASYTTVQLAPIGGNTGAARAKTPTMLDGVPARAGTYRTHDGRQAVVLVIPSRQVAVEVSAPTAAQARAIIDTVVIAPTDAHGCQDRVAPLTAASNPPAEQLMPGHPVSAVACEYSAQHRLYGSGPLTAAQLGALTRLVDEAGAATGGEYPGANIYARYLLHYADGSTRVIEAGLDLQPALVTDGRSTITTSAVRDLPRVYR